MLPTQIVYITILTSAFAGYFYIRDVFLGKTKPNIVSWFVWSLAPIIAGIVSVSKGSGLASLPIFMAAFTPVFVTLIALFKRNAFWNMNLFDYVCLVLSLLALVFWFVLGEGVIATIFAILSDLIAFLPTYKKSWTNPDTETVTPFYSGTFNAAISLLTLNYFTFVSAGFAMYLFFCNLAEIFIVLARQKTYDRS